MSGGFEDGSGDAGDEGFVEEVGSESDVVPSFGKVGGDVGEAVEGTGGIGCGAIGDLGEVMEHGVAPSPEGVPHGVDEIEGHIECGDGSVLGEGGGV